MRWLFAWVGILCTILSGLGCKGDTPCSTIVELVRRCQPKGVNPVTQERAVALCERAIVLYPDATRADLACAQSAKGDCASFNRCQRQAKLDELVQVLEAWQIAGREDHVRDWCLRYRGTIKGSARYREICDDILRQRGAPRPPKGAPPPSDASSKKE